MVGAPSVCFMVVSSVCGPHPLDVGNTPSAEVMTTQRRVTWLPVEIHPSGRKHQTPEQRLSMVGAGAGVGVGLEGVGGGAALQMKRRDPDGVHSQGRQERADAPRAVTPWEVPSPFLNLSILILKGKGGGPAPISQDCCVMAGRLLNVSGPQFTPLAKGRNDWGTGLLG